MSNNYKQYKSNGKNKTFTFGLIDTNNEVLQVLLNGNDCYSECYYYDSISGAVTFYKDLKENDVVEIYTTSTTDTYNNTTDKEQQQNQDNKHNNNNNNENDFIKTISKQLNNLEDSLKEYTNINIKKLLEEDLFIILNENLKKLKQYNDELIFNDDIELTKLKKSIKNYENIEKKVFEIETKLEKQIKTEIDNFKEVYDSGKVLDSGCSIEYSDRIGNRTFGLSIDKYEDNFDFYNIQNNTDRINLLSINKTTGNILPGYNGAQSLGQKNKQFKTVELSEGVIIKSIGDENNPQRFMLMIKDNGEIITERI